MREIELTQGKRALVDDDVYSFLAGFKWTAHKRRQGTRFYAYRNVRLEDGGLKPLFLHQAVVGMPIKKGDVIDHIDGNGLNNCRENLRIVSSGENITNSWRRREGKTHSRYPGVTWHKGKMRWYTSIRVNGKSRFLGTFKNEEDAAQVYRFSSERSS